MWHSYLLNMSDAFIFATLLFQASHAHVCVPQILLSECSDILLAYMLYDNTSFLPIYFCFVLSFGSFCLSAFHYSLTMIVLSTYEICCSYLCISLSAFMCLYYLVVSCAVISKKLFHIFPLCISICFACVSIAVPVSLDSSSRGLTYRIDAA